MRETRRTRRRWPRGHETKRTSTDGRSVPATIAARCLSASTNSISAAHASQISANRVASDRIQIVCWGGLQDDLNKMSKEGKWVEMGRLIDDDILNTFAVVGEPEKVAPELKRRYGDVIDRISFYAPYKSDPDRWGPVLDALRAA